jgi:hypothetical protein
VVALLVAVGAAGCDRGDDEALMPLGTDAPVSATTTTVSLSPKEQAAKDAEAVYRRFLKITRRMATSGGKDIDGIDQVAAGDALAQTLYGQRVYIDEGSRAAGEVKVVDLEVISATPERVTISSCSDDRRAYAIGRDGSKTRASDPFSRSKATLRSINDAWKVWTVESVGASAC